MFVDRIISTYILCINFNIFINSSMFLSRSWWCPLNPWRCLRWIVTCRTYEKLCVKKTVNLTLVRLLILLCETICNTSFGFCRIREWKLVVFSVTSALLWTQSNREQTLRQKVRQWSSHSQKWTWLACNHTMEGFVLLACETHETHCFAKLSLLHSVQCWSSQKFCVHLYVRLVAQLTVRCLH